MLFWFLLLSYTHRIFYLRFTTDLSSSLVSLILTISFHLIIFTIYLEYLTSFILQWLHQIYSLDEILRLPSFFYHNVVHQNIGISENIILYTFSVFLKSRYCRWSFSIVFKLPIIIFHNNTYRLEHMFYLLCQILLWSNCIETD